MLRFNGKEESQNGFEDVERENGDKSKYTYSPQPPTPVSRPKSPPMPTQTRNSRHSFISQDNLTPSKGSLYLPSSKQGVHPADAAAVLASLAPNNSKDIYLPSEISFPSPPSKYSVDDPKKHLKRSVSFNNSRRTSSPRQQQPYLDIAEALATSTSLIRENNKRILNMEHYSDNEIDAYSDDGADGADGPDIEFEEQIVCLSTELMNMQERYNEQLLGKDQLIKGLENAVKKHEHEEKKRKHEIERLERQLEVQRKAISELADQQHHEAELATRANNTDPKALETARRREQELREKDRAIEELNRRITIATRKAADAVEKESKLVALEAQLTKYYALENEWKVKEKTFESLSTQVESIKKQECEINEKNALIRTLETRLESTSKVIAELREKHAPHDLLWQLRQKDYIIDNLTQQVEDIDANLKIKDDEIECLTQRIAEESKLLEKLKEQNKQLDPFRVRAEDAEMRVGQLKRQLAEKERLLAEKEMRYNDATKSSREGSEKLRSQELNLANLRQEVEVLRQAVSTQSQEARDKETLLANLRNETAHMRSNYQGLLDALTEKDLKIQQLDQQIESLHSVANSASTEKDSKFIKNEVRLNALQKVLNSKIEACRDYERKIAELEEEFDCLKKQMEDSKTAGTEKEAKINRLLKVNRELKTEVTQLKQKMEEKEKELVAMRSRIPGPSPGSIPNASERKPRSRSTSRVRSSYSGESSSDEANGSRIRKHSSMSGLGRTPLQRSSSFTALSSVTPRRVSDSPRLSLNRTKSTTSTSSTDQRRASVVPAKREAKRDIKSRPMSTSSVDMLKKSVTSTKSQSRPINRSAVAQFQREHKVYNQIRSGVTPKKTTKLSSVPENHAAGTRRLTSANVERKKLSDLNIDAAASRSPTVARTSPPSPTKSRNSLTRPLPSKKTSDN
ncbi:191_t:CDS:2 [Paraglomus brasilianum]|uniref:191_t:CDS:1 n=1 Tax=Paraglomus brasilianum TaxID=144538 RepID=A0A9N9CYK4_9GLOM|nr:191_t:CDS:2 [Paraglomus brasilianum]